MKEIDIVFNSKENSGESFQIASGYISKTAMLFENEVNDIHDIFKEAENGKSQIIRSLKVYEGR